MKVVCYNVFVISIELPHRENLCEASTAAGNHCEASTKRENTCALIISF